MSARSAFDRYRETSKTLPHSHRSYVPLDHNSQSGTSHNRNSTISTSRISRRSLAAIALEKTSSALNNLVSIGSSTNPSTRSSPAAFNGNTLKPLPIASTSPPSTEYSLDINEQRSGNSFQSGVGGRGGAVDPFGLHSSPHAGGNGDTTNLRARSDGSGSPTYILGNLSNSSISNRRNTLQGNSTEVLQMPSAKMHQTSSRLLRMTSDDRPFCRDFKDLFSTLIVSLKLESRRVRFSKIDHSFMSEEAINNLGSLKFSQSNRMPDPKDPSRIVTTTTTTTFSMAREMARSVCQRFVDARFIEPVDGRVTTQFPLKGALFQLTPKGIHVLHRFCQRNGITSRHVMDLLESPRNTMQLVILERDGPTDQISRDRATIEVIFRRFAGVDGPNLKNNVSSSDSDSVSDYVNGTAGVKMAKERKIGDKVVQNSFTGKAAVDWILDCCTAIDNRETVEIATMFMKFNLIYAIAEDKAYAQQNQGQSAFQPTKYAIYGITEHGQRVCGWIARDKVTPSSLDGRIAPRDSNNARLNHILQDPALRLLFREFLRDSLCEENLSFYLDVSEFTADYHHAVKAGAFSKMDAVRETLASAYGAFLYFSLIFQMFFLEVPRIIFNLKAGLYNAFLAPGSPCELNIEHALRNSLASRMTRAVGDDAAIVKSLTEVVSLFELAQVSVFKLMSSDSVPKFVRDPRYATILQEHDFDLNNSGRSHSPTSAPIPDRSTSRSARS
ncbi:AMSH/STAMBP protein ubiquitin specific-protease [Emydomyces testavorans]|uniref:AMSH/STAMBP protein ubiquitin specific-protease n=1 Tax=Emydomyces testavorans TaxID=2070801 RepID=A0AAF0DLL9_9EURO|nr:AMSH/STAMBP protein ubiquitin specific-protease [Emydomyces testavorans]